MASNKNSPILFFKIITTTSIEGGKLKLPKAFTKKYSGDMSNPVILKPLDNTSWEIHCSKHDSEIWLEKGWEEFVNYYSLNQGHLDWHMVLFEFKDGSKFEVRIFDKNNTLELKYPSFSNKQLPHSATHFFRFITTPCLEAGKLTIPNGFMKKYSAGMSNPVFLTAPDNTSLEIHWSKHDSDFWFKNGWEEFVKYYSLGHGHLVLFEFKGASQFRVHIFDKTTLEIAYPSNENQGEEHNPDQIGDGSAQILDEILPPKKNKLKSPMSCSQPRKKLRTCTSKDVGKILELTKDDAGGSTGCLEGEQLTSAITNALKKAKGATFVIDLKSYSIVRHSVSIPSHFARQHLKNKKEIRLEVLDGTTWKVNYNVFKFIGGWHKFAADNNLEVGDVCVFELTKREPLSLKVLIFPQGGEASTSRRAPKLNIPPHFRYAAQKEAQIKSTTKNPSFIIHLKTVIKDSYRPIVPIAFIREYLNEKQTINLKFEENKWPVGFIYYPDHGLGKLSTGWKIFERESKLSGGDVCVFELINKNKKNPVLEVHIFKSH